MSFFNLLLILYGARMAKEVKIYSIIQVVAEYFTIRVTPSDWKQKNIFVEKRVLLEYSPLFHSRPFHFALSSFSSILRKERTAPMLSEWKNGKGKLIVSSDTAGITSHHVRCSFFLMIVSTLALIIFLSALSKHDFYSITFYVHNFLIKANIFCTIITGTLAFKFSIKLWSTTRTILPSLHF